jgi:hypothetical protein
MRRQANRRPLSVEALENRSLLAGNVLASVDASGLLTVVGDDAGNRIIVRQLPPTGPTTPWPGVRYSIESAWTRPGTEPTTINGQSAVTVEGVKSVAIDMEGGVDSVYVHNPNRPNSVASLPGLVNIDMGDNGGTDANAVEGLTLYVENHQEINLQLGRGSDYLGMRGVVRNLNVVGDPVFQAGDPPGPDKIDLGLTAGGAVSIDTKYGNDEVLLRSFVAKNATAAVSINTGSGDDRANVELGSGRFNSPLRIDTGDGNDHVVVGDIQQASAITVNTGRGSDSVWVQHSSGISRLSVWLGQGDDDLNLHSVTSLKTSLGGGDGTDTLQTFSNYPSDLGDSTITGFEVFVENPL